MEKEVSQMKEFRRYYLSEFELYDGEAFITFDVVAINQNRNEITVAVTDRGKISVISYDLFTDRSERLYFEYGCAFQKIYLDEFEEAMQ